MRVGHLGRGDGNGRRWHALGVRGGPSATLPAPILAAVTVTAVYDALPGGAIMNAALSAAHLAAEEGDPINGARLLRALRGEFRTMGQLFDDRITLAPEQGRAHMSTRPGLGRY